MPRKSPAHRRKKKLIDRITAGGSAGQIAKLLEKLPKLDFSKCVITKLPSTKINDSGTVALYRGDKEYIDKFKIDKTSKNGFWGRGIYLTDKYHIAETYRTKGAKGINYNDDVIVTLPTKNCDYHNMMSILEGLISRVNEKGVFCNKRDSNFVNISLDEAVEIYLKYYKDLVLELTNSLKYKVRLPILPFCGKVSKFVFPAYELVHCTLSTEGNISSLLSADKFMLNPKLCEYLIKSVSMYGINRSLDKLLIEFLIESHNIILGKSDLETFKQKFMTILSHISFHDLSKLDVTRLGYLGWWYEGGKNLNLERHNAFCIQDEDFVNYYRVE